MSEIERLGAAFHEAAHAIITILLDGQLSFVMIGLKNETWIGESPGSWEDEGGNVRKEKIIKAGLAGPLGQAKYRARLRWKKATFDTESSLARLVTVIRDGLTEETELGLDFVETWGVSRHLKIKDLNDVGDLEKLHSIAEAFSDNELIQL